MFGLAIEEIVLLAVAFVAFAGWVWALVDCAKHCRAESRGQWIVLIALLNCLGAVLYLVRRSRLVQP